MRAKLPGAPFSARIPPMSTAFAALLFRSDEIPDRALSQGFAVALGGFDVPRPHLLIAELRGAPGWSAAFYQSGAKLAKAAEHEELEHARELFEEELHPAVCALDAAAELGKKDAVVFALVFAESPLVDDAWRFGPDGYERRFVRDDEEEGLVAGVESAEASEITPIELEVSEEATEGEERAAVGRAAGPHRGSAFVERELRAPVMGALMGALFAPDRRVEVRLVEASPASIEEEVRRLNRALKRVDGRGAFEAPRAVAGVETPAVVEAFVRTYDFADPADPQDLYRELAIGAVEGTLRFFREGDLKATGESEAWRRASAARPGLYPVAALMSSALGRSRSQEATIALEADREHLALVKRDGSVAVAGPTFGELLRYLSLGWTSRSEEEEDFIGALMLRARLRAMKE